MNNPSDEFVLTPKSDDPKAYGKAAGGHCAFFVLIVFSIGLGALMLIALTPSPDVPRTTVLAKQRVETQRIVHEKEIKANLPTNAHNVKHLGHGWATFELDIDGIRHKFLWHKEIHRLGYQGFEAITEIK